MPREREYGTNAERQAAYRARHARERPPRQDLLAALGRSLHGELAAALRGGGSPLPKELLGARADETLRNLIFYVRSGGDPESQREK
jgi:hypothetical protein